MIIMIMIIIIIWWSFWAALWLGCRLPTVDSSLQRSFTSWSSWFVLMIMMINMIMMIMMIMMKLMIILVMVMIMENSEAKISCLGLLPLGPLESNNKHGWSLSLFPFNCPTFKVQAWLVKCFFLSSFQSSCCHQCCHLVMLSSMLSCCHVVIDVVMFSCCYRTTQEFQNQHFVIQWKVPNKLLSKTQTDESWFFPI